MRSKYAHGDHQHTPSYGAQRSASYSTTSSLTSSYAANSFYNNLPYTSPNTSSSYLNKSSIQNTSPYLNTNSSTASYGRSAVFSPTSRYNGASALLKKHSRRDSGTGSRRGSLSNTSGDELQDAVSSLRGFIAEKPFLGSSQYRKDSLSNQVINENIALDIEKVEEDAKKEEKKEDQNLIAAPIPVKPITFLETAEISESGYSSIKMTDAETTNTERKDCSMDTEEAREFVSQPRFVSAIATDNENDLKSGQPTDSERLSSESPDTKPQLNAKLKARTKKNFKTRKPHRNSINNRVNLNECASSEEDLGNWQSPKLSALLRFESMSPAFPAFE